MDTTAKIMSLLQNPKARTVFERYSLRCATCKGIEQETLRQVIYNNGLDEKTFLTEIEDAIK